MRGKIEIGLIETRNWRFSPCSLGILCEACRSCGRNSSCRCHVGIQSVHHVEVKKSSAGGLQVRHARPIRLFTFFQMLLQVTLPSLMKGQGKHVERGGTCIYVSECIESDPSLDNGCRDSRIDPMRPKTLKSITTLYLKPVFYGFW